MKRAISSSFLKWHFTVFMLLTLLACSLFRVGAQELDPSFAPPLFWERFNNYTFSQGPYRTFADAQSGVFVVGNGGADVVGGSWQTEPIRLFITSAAVDASFRSQVSGGFATAIQPDGKLIITTRADSADVVVRLAANGTLDPTFEPVGFDQTVRHLGILPDGKILVTIWGNTFASHSPAAIAVSNPTILRLHTNGVVDTSFQRTVFGGSPFYLAQPVADAAGRLYVGGRFTSVNGVTRTNVARLSPNGEVDLSFTGAASVPGGLGGTVRETGLQSDGRVVVVGDLRVPANASSGNRIAALRFNDSGQFDASFATNKVNALGLTDYPRAMVMLPDDKFLTVSSGLRRFNANGTRDTTFNEQNFTGYSFFLSRLSDGRLLVPGGNPDKGLNVFFADGTPDSSFDPGGFGRTTPPSSYAFLSNGRLAVCGQFNRMGAQSQLGLALLDQATGQTVPSQPTLGGLTSTDTMSRYSGSDAFKLVAGHSNSVWFLAAMVKTDAYARQVIGKFLENGEFDPATPVQNWSGAADLLPLPDGRLLVVDNSPQGAVYDEPLIRLQSNASYDPTFPGLDPALRAQMGRVTRDLNGQLMKVAVGSLRVLCPSGPSHYLASLNTINGDARLVRFGFDGTQDAGFAALGPSGLNPWLNYPEVYNPVTGTLEQPAEGVDLYDRLIFHDAAELAAGGFLVCGQFHTLSGLSISNLARIHANGSVDTNFSSIRLEYTKSPFWEPRITAIEVEAQGRAYVAGLFDRINGVAAPGLARLLADGTVDSSFQSPITILLNPNLNVQLKLVDEYLYVFGYAAHGETRRMGWRLKVGLVLGFDTSTGGAEMSLIVPGDSNRETVLQASDDLTGWGDIFTNAAGAASVRFTDPGATSSSSRFYRLRQ
jgi:uncharacterized delta-60 repeat protein